MNERQRRRFEALRADQQLIDRAAAWLRHDAIQDAYAGLRDKDRAFEVASILDVLSRHLADVENASGRRWCPRAGTSSANGPPTRGGGGDGPGAVIPYSVPDVTRL